MQIYYSQQYRLKSILLKILVLSCLLAIFMPIKQAKAEGQLTIYCSVQYRVCEKMTQIFGEKYHVDAKFVRNSTGSTLSKIKAESTKPQGDIWYGGTLEPHFQAAELGLLYPYRSPKQAETIPQLKSLLAKHGDYTSIGYMIVLGMGVNTE